MARIENSFLKGFSGKVGNIVGVKTKTGYYIRRSPAKSLKPPTVNQLGQRMKFKLAQSFLAGLRPLLKTMPLTGEKQSYAYSAAVGQVVREAIDGIYPAQAINFPAVKLTFGVLDKGCDHVVTAEQSSLHFSWCPARHDGIYQNVAVLLAYSPGEDQWGYQLATLDPGCFSATLTLSSNFAGHKVETWIYFLSWQAQGISDSVYTGRHLCKWENEKMCK